MRSALPTDVGCSEENITRNGAVSEDGTTTRANAPRARDAGLDRPARIPNAERPAAMTTDITVNPGYSLTGLGVSAEAHRTLSVFLRIDNLGDTGWDSALGYPGLPRAAVVGERFNVSARWCLFVARTSAP